MAWPVLPHGFLGAQVSGDNDQYQISRSLRFNSADSAYLSRTPASAGNRKTWTWSGWVKRSVNERHFLLSQYSASNDNSAANIFFNASNQLVIAAWSTSWRITNRIFRDNSAWYHIVANIDTTNATAGDRVKIYINGVEETSFATTNNPTLNTDLGFNTTSVHEIGRDSSVPSVSGTFNYFNGYLTEVNFIDGQALTPSSFGETDGVTGRWKAKAYSGTYGTNGFYLPFSTNTLSTDLTNTATLTAPFGGTANNAKVSDGVYVTSNTSTGSTFTFVQQDFGAATQLTRYSIANLYFTGGASTFQVHYGDDPTWNTFKVAGSLSVTGSAQNFSGSINGFARYVRIAPTSFGTNGQANLDSFIIFQDGLGLDSSNNGNNWTPNNFSVTAGAGNDSLVDSPTNYGIDTGLGGEVRGNYATLNPLFGNIGGTISDGNLVLTHTGGANGKNALAVSSIAMSSGKWYCEFTNTVATTSDRIGIINAANTSILTSGNPYITQYSDGYGAYVGGGTYKENNNSTSSITNFGSSSTSNNDVYMVALDMDNNKVWFGRNGSWANSGNPASGTTETFSVTSGRSYLFACNTYLGDTQSANFGQRPFAYAAPSGFKALCTTNLPTPVIKKPSTAMDVVTWTSVNGSGSVNVAFQPDFSWIKDRDSAVDHYLHDSVRTFGKYISSNLTNAEATGGGITSVSSTGFNYTIGNSNRWVGWNWKANGSGSSNNSGSITSTVSVNALAGFSIVSYTGTGANATVGHGLGVAPKMYIVKQRNGADAWGVYHASAGATPQNVYLRLNTTAATVTDSSVWNNTAPTTSTFAIGTWAAVNANAGTYIAYCFAEVDGYSKFGSYTGNGSTDGPFVWCGFRPKFILLKSSSAAYNWHIFDTARNVFNVVNGDIVPNLSSAENTANNIMDVNSNGFKMRIGDAGWNDINTYIFAAFAEIPFRYARAR